LQIAVCSFKIKKEKLNSPLSASATPPLEGGRGRKIITNGK